MNRRPCRIVPSAIAVALVAVVAAGQTVTPSVSEQSRQDAQVQADGLRAQKITIYRMATLSDLIKSYVREHERCPESLSAVGPYVTPEALADLILDGWGRPIRYYSSGTDYALVCYGFDGLASLHQTVSPGGYTHQLDFDADIVILNGNWAQSPAGLDRPF